MKALENYEPIALTADQAQRMKWFKAPSEYVRLKRIEEQARGCRKKLKASLDCYDAMVDLAIQARADTTRTMIHNNCVLPMLGKVQEYSDQCRERMPMVDIPYGEARKMLKETLYAAIKQATQSNRKHRKVNDLHGYKDEVELVVECLLNADAQGHDTHGMIRMMRYVEAILNGRIKPNAKVTMYEKRRGLARFDGHGAFGQVGAQMATQYLLEQMAKPNVHTMTVTAFNMGHAGRLEFILRQIADAGYLGLAMYNVQGWGRTGLPDCIEGDWGTNPFGIANSTGAGKRVSIIDFATTARPEGFVKVSLQNGLLVPIGVLVTADGIPVMDPALLYTEDHAALLEALGGAIARYKGAAFGMGVRDFVDGVNGHLPDKDKIMLGGNSLFLYAVKPGEHGHEIIDGHLRRVSKSKTASGEPVRMPGEHGYAALQKAKKSSISVAKGTVKDVVKLYEKMCV